MRYEHPAESEGLVTCQEQLSVAPSQTFNVAVRQYNKSYGCSLKGDMTSSRPVLVIQILALPVGLGPIQSGAVNGLSGNLEIIKVVRY